MKRFFTKTAGIAADTALWIWQLPQNLCGLACILIPGGTLYRNMYPYPFRHRSGLGGAVTLGRYIFSGSKRESVIRHEWGHTRQSLILGPLYIVVIGLPSLVHAWLHGFLCGSGDYYHFYTERWADALADRGWDSLKEGGA